METKKKNEIRFWVTMILLLSLTFWIGGYASHDWFENEAMAKESIKSLASTEEYSIEYLSSRIVRVIGARGKGLKGTHGERTYGDSFAKAIQEIEKTYDIKNITPINSLTAGGASPTKELLIIVKPKSSSEGAEP